MKRQRMLGEIVEFQQPPRFEAVVVKPDGELRTYFSGVSEKETREYIRVNTVFPSELKWLLFRLTVVVRREELEV